MNLKIIIKKITGNCKLEYSDIKGAGLSWFLEIDFFGGTYNVKDEKFHRLLFEFSSNFHRIPNYTFLMPIKLSLKKHFSELFFE